jgi:hypothetical protein
MARTSRANAIAFVPGMTLPADVCRFHDERIVV